MPQARTRRVDQCCYMESGRRCRRSATGNPPLCNPHKIAVAEQVRRDTSGEVPRAGAGVYELFDRIVSGRKVNRKVVEEAFGDVSQWWNQYVERQEAQQQHDPHHQRQRTWYGHQPNDPHCPCIACSVSKRGRATDPRAAEIAQRRARARAALGFTPTEPVSEDVLKKRHRELVAKHHPDRGGNPARMAEINDAVDVIRESLVS